MYHIALLRNNNWLVILPALALLTINICAQSASAISEMTDQSIKDKIDDELVLDPGVTSMKITVQAEDGIATLTGQVNNILAKERAARIAEAVKGVRAVVNRIEITTTSHRSDAEIQQDIERALFNDPAADAYEIAVSVDAGVASLTGTVDSYQERELVKTVAKGVRGVRDLQDQIILHYKNTRSDNEIQQEIQEVFRWNVYVDDQLLSVAVERGAVKLAGTVGSASEKRLATADAWVAGVKSVDNSQLTVERWARDKELRGDKFVVKSEDELREAVIDAMAYDPRVLSFDVDVAVEGGTVTLRGTVDNLKAKRAAEEDASNTVGVAFVDNRLRVNLDNPPTDDEVAQKIRDAYLRDPYVERFNITTSVIDGTAHLYGTVDSYLEKNRANDLASRVNGVVDVNNHLRIDYAAPYIYDPYVDDGYVARDELVDFERRVLYVTDAQLVSAIERELWWSPFVNADEIRVEVDDGIATLTGAVDTWSERRTATENAYEAGATLVDNDLIVNYQ